MITAVIERFKIVFNIWHFLQIDQCLGRVNYFLLKTHTIHIQYSSQHTVCDQTLIAHDFRTVEGWQHIDKQFTSCLKIPRDQTINTFIYFQFVLTLPITTLLKQSMTFLDVVFDFGYVAKFEKDGNEFESNVHFSADFDCLFECQVIVVNRVLMFFM